ncbi:MAG: hypothetical protein AB1918_09075 [Pseudomonadota bacterium]
MIITVVRSAEFSLYAPTRDAAVLRIHDPVEDWAPEADRLKAAGWGATLSLAFWDVGVQGMSLGESLVARLLGRWRGLALRLGDRFFPMGDDIPWRPFLAADARDIAAFADALPDRGIRHLMVVCGNGRARSWTVAKWLSRRLSASLTAAHGWERESAAIARTLARVPPSARRAPATAYARLEAAE